MLKVPEVGASLNKFRVDTLEVHSRQNYSRIHKLFCY